LAAYAPKAGREPQLLVLVARHAGVRRREALIADHPVSVMRAAKGTIIEVVE